MLNQQIQLKLTVNGSVIEKTIEPRISLADFLREELKLTGTHLGCEHGVCGACTVIVDDQSVRSCLMLAIQANDSKVRTVEGLSKNEKLNPLQLAMMNNHGLQCGFCTPGVLMSLTEFIEQRKTHDRPTESEIREALSGNICRCTGYQTIIDAVFELWDQGEFK
jgi:carbon-monoxide dehydrogenase small subunit